MTGPDNWLYATVNNGRIPGAPRNPGSAAGHDVDSSQFRNQVEFFKISQLGPYLTDPKVCWCPKDVSTRQKSGLKELWLARPVKLTSYCWNGTIGGYNNLGRGLPFTNGKTYKLTDFLPTDWQLWEQNELDPFNFNDASNVPPPGNAGNGLSIRHAGIPGWWRLDNRNAQSNIKSLPGGAVIGTFSGSAEFEKWTTALELINGEFPNRLFNGPIYSR